MCMKSWELLRIVFKQAGAKSVARDLNLSLSLIHKWSEPAVGTGSGELNPLDRVAALMRITGDRRLAQWICEQAEGYFVPNPKVKGAREFIPAASAASLELARMQELIALAEKHQRVTCAEAEAMRRQCEVLKSVLEDFVTGCEQGRFEECAAAKFGQAETGRSSLNWWSLPALVSVWLTGLAWEV